MKELWSLEANTISKLFKKKEISAVEIYNETIFDLLVSNVHNILNFKI